MNTVRAMMISAVLLSGAAFGQGAMPLDSGGSTGVLTFGFGRAKAQQPEYYTISAKASVTSYKTGESFYIALRGKVANTYHAYWRNPGTVGDPATASLQAPEGFKVEGPYWEVPHRVKGEFSTSYSYEAPIVVWKVTPEANAPQQAQFTVESSAQTCNDNGCNAAEPKTAQLVLNAGDGAPQSAWEQEQQKVETLGDSPVTVSATQTKDTVTLLITGQDSIEKAYFFSDDNSINPAAEQQLSKTDAGYALSLPRNNNEDVMHPVVDESTVGKELNSLSGILTFDGKHAKITVTPAAVTDASPAPAESTPTPTNDEQDEAVEDEEEDEEEETATGSLFDGGSSLFGPQAESAKPNYTATAKASVTTYSPGKSFYIAMNGKVADTYHAYWRNPATVGNPITATLTAPQGFKVEGPYWEIPHRTKGEFNVSYSYEAPIAVWKVTPEAGAPQKAQFSIESSAQTCNDTGCNPPETVTATLELTLGEGVTNADWQEEESLVEVLGDSTTTVTATQTLDSVILNISGVQHISTAYFFSDDNSINPVAEQTLTATENGFTLTLPRNNNEDTMHPVQDEAVVGKELQSIKGILTFDGKHVSINIDLTPQTEQTPAVETKQEPAPAKATPAPAKTDGPTGFWGILGYLFLGGLILNFMPCVFPVIGLKIMGFVEMGGGDRRKVFMHSAIFALGIILSFLVLALLLLVFTNAENRSWAMWMQNSWVVYGILLLFLTLGLSMFGVFEIGVGATGIGQGLQNKQGVIGTFFQGIFITIVATPCSAPFLGSAMPMALSLPDAGMVVSFCFMGLGLAFPYIILGAFPSLLKFLPRPGAWMEALKQGLSFLLFAAAAWILDTYLEMIDGDKRMVMLIGLAIYCAAFWAYGRWCPMYQSAKTRIIGALVALLLLGGGVWCSMPLEESASVVTASTSKNREYTVANGDKPIWNTWTPELMQAALADGHPVYVDFTAKWCATCQVNKKVAYSEEVCRKFADKGVVLMRADKTKPNSAIDAELSRLGRSQVPTNVLYIPKNAAQTHITTEVFTADNLSNFISEHLSDTETPAADN